VTEICLRCAMPTLMRVARRYLSTRSAWSEQQWQEEFDPRRAFWAEGSTHHKPSGFFIVVQSRSIPAPEVASKLLPFLQLSS
jgi:hypothetical protein